MYATKKKMKKSGKYRYTPVNIKLKATIVGAKYL